jgi:hypothetical protein
VPAGRRAALRLAAARSAAQDTSTGRWLIGTGVAASTYPARQRASTALARVDHEEQIVALHQEGLSQRMIARHLHVSRKVVRRSLTAGAFPERAPTGRRETPTRSVPSLSAQALGGGLSQRPATRARTASPRISRMRLAGPSSHWRMESTLAWDSGASARQETTSGSTRQAPSVSPACVLVVRHRPEAAYGRPAGAHRAHLPDQCRLPGTLSASPTLSFFTLG